MKLPIRCALIGVGGVGRYHRSAMSVLEKEGLIKLVAVADPDRRLLEERRVAAQRGVRWYENYEELLAEDLDSISVATPIPLHYSMAVECIKRGLPTLLEKPPVPLSDQLEKLIALDRDNRILVGFQMIHSKPSQQVKALICRGKLGRVREIRVSACWPRGDEYYGRASWAGRLQLKGNPVFDGPATNALAHMVHYAMYFASPEPNRFAIPEEVVAELYRARPIESYDLINLRGLFKDGTRLTMAMTHACQGRLPYTIEVIGDNGWAKICEDEEEALSNISLLDDVMPDAHPVPEGSFLLQLYRDFIGLVNGDSTRPCSRLVDTRGYVRTTNAALISSGKIHDIPSGFVLQPDLNPCGQYVIAGIEELIQECACTGRLFSEQGVPWAVQGAPVTVTEKMKLNLNDYLPAGSLNTQTNAAG